MDAHSEVSDCSGMLSVEMRAPEDVLPVACLVCCAGSYAAGTYNDYDGCDEDPTCLRLDTPICNHDDALSEVTYMPDDVICKVMFEEVQVLRGPRLLWVSLS